MENIYELKLHEGKRVGIGNNSFYVTRVPGGWLYSTSRLGLKVPTTTFVPFDNGFQ